MKSHDDQLAVLNLFEKGVYKKRIARLLSMDLKTVRKIIKKQMPVKPESRSTKIHINEQLLGSLYADCDGYVQRVYEKLTEEYNMSVSYSTVLRLLKEYSITSVNISRSDRVADTPGEEMQHDTSDHWIVVGNKKHKFICSGLYMRYSKMRYIKYYRRFNRFTMKCFMDEALRFWNYCASTCIIDNTSLAIDYGSGRRAVFSKEMVTFGRNYGFEWYAHEIRHSNRKAGKERNFRTVETNFLPGRSFKSLEDLNRQAFEWATQRYANRPQSKTKLIPSQLFAYEKPSLIKIPPFIHPPCQNHERVIDQYGYIAFNGNYYWVPDETKVKKVSLILYANHIDIYDGMHNKVIQHQLFDELSKNMVREPENKKNKKRRNAQPNNFKHNNQQEEKKLRACGEVVNAYIDFVKSNDSGIAHRYRYIRNLYAFMKRTTQSLFTQAIQRALNYKVNDIHQISNIFAEILKQPLYEKPSTQSVSEYMKRKEYRDGRFTSENDLGEVNQQD